MNSYQEDDFPEGATPVERDAISEIASHYEAILKLVGDDPSREGLRKTPMRAARALWYATSGNRSGQPADLMRKALFSHEGSQMVVVRDIEFYSLCEHHILPFFGTVSVGYIPDGQIVGLSKLARVVDICARKLQVQERLTREVADIVASTLGSKGVLVVCDAQHMCMKMRGVEKQESSTVTIDYNGVFADDPGLRCDTLETLRAK